MQVHHSAHRALAHVRRLAGAFIVIGLLAGMAMAVPSPAAAAGPKVVIIVGPVGTATSRYIARANAIAVQAAAYGATVVKVYTPRATWARVKAAAQGAKVLVYLGHGNGWPSPYGPFQRYTKDGFGLNPVYGHGTTSPVKYIGELYIASGIRLAPGAVVLLNHLCYASGNGEPGSKEPTWSVARRRVDNFAAGFIGAGAKAVIAEGHSDLSHDLALILGPGTRNLADAWMADWESRHNTRRYASTRRPGYTNYVDPDRASSGFYRALTTRAGFITGGGGTVPTPTPTPDPTPAPSPKPSPTTPPDPTPAPDARLVGTALVDTSLRAQPDRNAASLAAVRSGTTVTVVGAFVVDASGRTWAKVATSGGTTGFISARLATYAGTAHTATAATLFTWPDPASHAIATLAPGTRLSITGTRAGDSVVWLGARTSAGTNGWVDARFLAP